MTIGLANAAVYRVHPVGTPRVCDCRMEESPRDPQTYAIIGAAMAVHRELGCGFLEAVYRPAFEIELRDRGIPHAREVALSIRYKGCPLPVRYRVDFICYESVVVELKAIATIGAIEQAQAINYLRASGCERALILNFGATRMEYRRVVYELGRRRIAERDGD